MKNDFPTNMEGDHIKINKWLLPLSCLYGCGVRLRNLLFEMNILKSRSFSIPVISVGNITVGGSGKTPHVEYLVNLLHRQVHTSVLSRGYKRKSKGYVLANSKTKMSEIGDEPYQMHLKFPDVTVAVDANRCRGIDNLITSPETQGVGVVILDDAFQHRYVKPGMNIMLTDYHRIVTEDTLLPAGRLREPVGGKDRADIVIVTKCPAELKPMEYRVLQRNLNLYPYQSLFFTTIKYCPLEPVFIEAYPLRQPDMNIPKDNLPETLAIKLPNVLLLTGIASPKQMIEDLKPLCQSIQHVRFADHHQFTPSDAESISFAYKMIPKPAIIITTEKDAMRLQDLKGLSAEVRKNIYFLPIKVEFLLGEAEKFNKIILDYVQKNTINNRMVKRSYGQPATAEQPAAIPTTNSNNTRNRTGNAGGTNRDLFGNSL